MTSLERALADYRRRVGLYPMEKYPVAWTGHYADGTIREITAPRFPGGEHPVGRVALGMMSVFSSPEVDASWLVIDGTRVPGTFNLSRMLLVSSLVATEKGIYNGNWKVGAEGVAHPSFYEVPEVNQALSAVMDLRLARPTSSFDDAFWAAVEVGRELYHQEVDG